MKNIWAYITYVTSYFSFSSVVQDQQYLDGHAPGVINVHNDVTVVNVAAPAVSSIVKPHVITPSYVGASATETSAISYPSFVPPTLSRPKADGTDFGCEYEHMTDYTFCNSESDRGCWLKHKDDPKLDFSIFTDYEKRWPIGKLREYTLVVEDGKVNADGFWAHDAKLINGSYPGPLIQACWGDTVRVKVINKLKHNGTAMHWHGVRQFESMHMDGVPGITQCPIAPDDYFTYEFNVTQYGSSWYHSHYSVQYADGLLGPITFHGPTSGVWDEVKSPLLMSDWFHNSAFQVIHEEVAGYPTILLNGVGDISKHKYDDGFGGKFSITPNAPIPPKYTLTFQRGKKYLLRLINTSFSTTFAFSIDHHRLTVVSADFVPVSADQTKKTHIQIGIGQRYNVIVEAEPDMSEAPIRPGGRPPQEYWIRTSVMKCFIMSAIGISDYELAGIVRYEPDPVYKHPSFENPFTTAWANLPAKCADEAGFNPILRWEIPEGAPVNADPEKAGEGDDPGQLFGAHRNASEALRTYPLSNWAFVPGNGPKSDSWNSLQVDYHDPFFLRLKDVDKKDWPEKWMIVPADYTDDDWVFIALLGKKREGSFGAHPIHLHGHDFAVLQVEHNITEVPFEDKNFKFKRDNPMRRDVVLLPANGWVVIGFKTDNPGSWIVHCHIAFHASEGLGFTINERQREANNMWPNPDKNNKYDSAIVEANRVCKRWRDFEDDCTRHWPGKNVTANCWPACHSNNATQKMYACPKDEIKNHVFMDDSGV